MSFSTSSRSEWLTSHVLVASFKCLLRVRSLSEQRRTAKTKSTGVKRAFLKGASVSLAEASFSRPSSWRSERPSLRLRPTTEACSFSVVWLSWDVGGESAASSSRLVGNEAVFVLRVGADDVLPGSAEGFEFGFVPEKDAVEESSAVAAVRSRPRENLRPAKSFAFALNTTHVKSKPTKMRRIL